VKLYVPETYKILHRIYGTVGRITTLQSKLKTAA